MLNIFRVVKLQIEHKQIVDNGNTVIYINVYIEDRYEFGKENFEKNKSDKNIKKRIMEYVRKNVVLVQGAIIVIAINGMVVGALSLDKATEYVKEEKTPQITEQVAEKSDSEIENETENESEIQNENENKNKDLEETVSEKSENVVVKAETKTDKNNEKTNDKVSNTNANTNTTTPTTTAPKEETSVKEDEELVTDTKQYISLNINGEIKSLELEEYIIGVVAAEMPASFNLEALKAQAIATRTYAMKKTSQGKTLMSTTADQVYKTTAQMKNTWGSEYNYYYNRVKSAVDATRGLVIKYNGEYIDAQYSAMTNGKTELPEYVWSFSRPYLQCVSSSWDEKVKNFEVTKSFSYDKVSSLLGQTVTKDTEIEVLKRTVSDRVESIRIGDKTYTGVEVRSMLGLRSTDFVIELGESINITTKGYGHGVGMSQYGANVAANEGYTYSEILSHYYVGTNIESIY